MCCFSQSVQRVVNTRIFSRRTDESRQAIAYQMEFATDSDLAMILLLPVSVGSGEEAVKFINLKEYETFFSDGNLYRRRMVGDFANKDIVLGAA